MRTGLSLFRRFGTRAVPAPVDYPLNAVLYNGQPVMFGGEYVTYGTLTADTTGVSADSVRGTADHVYVPPPFVPTDVEGLQLWLDASDASTITDAGAGAVSQWNDKSGNGYSFTQGTSALRPTTGVTSRNGRNTLSFAGDYLTEATASLSAFNYLHNGTSYTLFAVWKAGVVANPDTLYGLLGTGANTSAQRGAAFFFDDRSSVPREELIAIFIGSAVGAQAPVSLLTATDSWAANEYALLTAQVDPDNGTAANRALASRNGSAMGGANTNAFAVSAGNATNALQIGAYGNNGAPLTGEIAEIIVYNRVLSAGEIDNVEGYLAAKWGVTLSAIAALSPALWLRASDLALSNTDPVASWTSREGSSIVASQATSGNRPTYRTSVLNGKPVVRFDATDYLDLDATGDTLFKNIAAVTYVVVAKTDPSAAYAAPFFGSVNSTTDSVRTIVWKSNTDNLEGYARVDDGGSTDATVAAKLGSDWGAIVFQADYTSGEAFVRKYPGAGNGAQGLATGTFDNTDSAVVRIGGYALAGGIRYPWTGDVAEIIVFQAALTPAQIATVLTELNGIYALDTAPAFASWQNEGDPVSIGGIDRTDWLASTAVSGGATSRTFISPGAAIRGKTTIRSLHVNVHAGSNTAKVKLFRANGSTWDMVHEQSFTLAGAGTQIVTLSPAWAAEAGDVLGLWLQTTGAGVKVSEHTSLSTLYTTGDITGTGNTFGSSVTQEMEIEARGDRVGLAITGDSIIGGHTDWQTPQDTYTPGAGVVTIPGGDSAFEVGAQLAISGLTWANSAKGGETFAWVAGSGWPEVIRRNPHTIVIAAGVNDVSAARTWAAVEADLDTIKWKFDRSGAQRLFICEILPWTAGSDVQAATIRAWNGNLATWCLANGVTLIATHDAMGQTRGSTGELDDLATAYDKDGVHLTSAGVTALAAIIEAAL